MAVLLAWVAGFVNAVGYLVLLHLAASHMSGNTEDLGVYLAQANWQQAIERWSPIPLFLFGAFAGVILGRIAVRSNWRSAMAVTLGVEFLLLGAWMGYGMLHVYDNTLRLGAGWQFYLMVALAAVPMGFQTVSVQQVSGRNVRTTYITGMLIDMVDDLAAYLFWLRDHLWGQTLRPLPVVMRVSVRQQSLKRVWLLALIWTFFLIGALTGAYVELRWGLISLAWPMGVLLVLILVDLLWPTKPPRRAPLSPS